MVFVVLNVGAVEGAARWVRPNQVRRMTDAQAGHDAEAGRDEWLAVSMRSETEAIKGRWFMSEPDNLLIMHRGREIAGVALRDLMRVQPRTARL